MNAFQKLQKKNKENKYICVGLDTDIEKIPSHLKQIKDPVLEFNRRIIESTCEFAAAYKINFAFYEKLGAAGFDILKETVEIIPKDILIIGDAKRGDIGNTSKYYAESIFEYFGFDSVTVNPYMGLDSVRPFLEYDNKLIFLLALTSNPGADDFEKLQLNDGGFLFQNVIKKIKAWNEKDNCGIVFGATKIDELKENINSFEKLPVLLPGVGAQGAKLDDIMNVFIQYKKLNLLINVSRGIIYRDSSRNFASAAKNEIIQLNNSVEQLLSK